MGETNANGRLRVLIVGGVAGGASAATRLRRLSEEAEIVLLERGEHVSFANCGLPYHIGEIIPERNRLLVQTPEGLRKRYRLDVRTRVEAVRLARERQVLVVRDLKTGRESEEPYTHVVLSPGAEPVRPPIPGANSGRVLTLRSLADMDAIKRVVDTERPARALILGGGYIGLEMAEALHARKVAVILVELSPQAMGVVDPEMAAPIHQELRLRGVDLRLNRSVTAFREAPGGLEAQLSDGETVACGLAIIAVGVRPEARLAREAGLTLGPRGGIAVNAHQQTSDPRIYAVGDAVEVPDFVTRAPALVPLAGPANRQGRIAADHLCGRASAYRGTQGTAICKVFGLAIGVTGLTEKAAQRQQVRYEKVYVHPASHAGYYPGAQPLALKVLFDPENGKLLGAQASGADGVDKRIDVLAVALRAGLTVFDLEHLELSYAPPYGSAKDPVNYAGFVAANALRGDVKLAHAADALQPRDDQVLLDVRTPEEVKAGAIPGARNLPVDELRARLGELNRDKEWLVYCQVGLRGYLACRILAQHGFRCRNLSGGYKTFLAVAGPGAVVQPPPAPKEVRDDAGAEPPRPPAAPASGSAAPPATSPNAAGPAAPGAAAAPTHFVDACGLQCPGPILKLKAALDAARVGEQVRILATDPGFAADVEGWCASTGHEFLGAQAEAGGYAARVCKREFADPAAATPACGARAPKQKTIVVFSGDFDRAMAAFIIANGAAAMGSAVTLFFTFWGLNVLRRPQAPSVRKTLLERMFGWMMPRGAERLGLSRMNMGGMGKHMIAYIMRRKNAASLPDLIASAQKSGVRLVACTMSMDLMGLKLEELIPGVEQGGVAMYLSRAEAGTVNLFI